jgi:transcriptional antiterminator RfaH
MSHSGVALRYPATVTEKWYAVQTYPNHEKRVTAEFVQHGITAFLPLLRARRQWSDRTQLIEVPIFSCYTFVRMDSTPEHRATILGTRRVIRLLSAHNEPLPIPENEIESMRTIVASEVPFAAHTFLTAGQKVRIRGGCLDGVEGILTRINGKRNLVISIELIQQSASITVEGYRVVPV